MIHDNLKKLLETFKIDIKELSLSSGIKTKDILSILSQEIDPPLSLIAKLAYTINVDFNTLLGEPQHYNENYLLEIQKKITTKKLSFQYFKKYICMRDPASVL